MTSGTKPSLSWCWLTGWPENMSRKGICLSADEDLLRRWRSSPQSC